MLLRRTRKNLGVLTSMAVAIREVDLDFERSSDDIPAGYNLDELKKAKFKPTGIRKNIKTKQGQVELQEFSKKKSGTICVAFYNEDSDIVVFSAVLEKNKTTKSYVVVASSTNKEHRKQGLGLSCYEAMFQIYGKLQGDEFQTEGARALWSRLANIAKVDLVNSNTGKVIVKNIKPNSILDSRIWERQDFDDEEEIELITKDIKSRVLVLNSIRTGTVK